MKFITAFFMAWGGFLSIPCPVKKWDEAQRKLMLVFLPMAGLVLGILWYVIFRVMYHFKLPVMIISAVLTAYPFLASGFIHLDGFMDCCDAILSRRSKEERLRILKDSHVGAFAVIMVVMLFMFYFSAMTSQLNNSVGILKFSQMDMVAIIFIPVVSRAMSAFAVLTREPLSQSQYHTFKKQENRKYYIAVIIIAILAQLISILYYSNIGNPVKQEGIWKSLFAIFCVENLAHALSLEWCKENLGGMSGDISGFAITVSELAAIVTLAII